MLFSLSDAAIVASEGSRQNLDRAMAIAFADGIAMLRRWLRLG